MITGDPSATAGMFGATYRGTEAFLNGAGWSGSLRAAARGYYEGVAVGNSHDIRVAIQFAKADPETGQLTGEEIQAGAKQNQSALSEAIGITLVAAAVVATSIEGTTSQNSGSIEIAQSAKQGNEIHLTVYSRPVWSFWQNGPRHMFIRDGAGSWEMGPQGGALGRIGTTSRDIRQTGAYLDSYKGRLKNSLTVTVNAEKYEAMKQLYEKRNVGKSYLLEYILKGRNSNRAVEEVVGGSGGKIEGDMGWTPGRRNQVN